MSNLIVKPEGEMPKDLDFKFNGKTLRVFFDKDEDDEEMVRKYKVLWRNGFISGPFFQRVEQIFTAYDTEAVKEQSMKLEAERGEPTLVFENGAIVSDNFLRKFVNEDTIIKTALICPKLKNKHKTCQSTLFLFAGALAQVENPLKNLDFYFDADGNQYEIPFETMSADIMEDLAFSSVIYDRGLPPLKSTGMQYMLHERRRFLVMGLQKKFEEYIKKGYTQPVFQWEHRYSALSYFILYSSLIKRMYKINIFAGDGSDFCLAYVRKRQYGHTKTEKDIFVHKDTQINYCGYTSLPKTDKKYTYFVVDFVAHIQNIIVGEGTMVYLNCQNHMTLFDSSNGKSSLAKLFKLLTAAAQPKKADESIDSYLNFSRTSCCKGKFLGFYNLATLKIDFPEEW